jgi:hypothetical protein
MSHIKDEEGIQNPDPTINVTSTGSAPISQHYSSETWSSDLQKDSNSASQLPYPVSAAVVSPDLISVTLAAPATVIATPSSNVPITATAAAPVNSDNVFSRLTKAATWTGMAIFNVLERVGETVVSVLGIDDSRYQDILDTMTEDELARARAVQAEREAEYDRVRCIKELRQKEHGELAIMEEGSS